jgi:hypothetical protein
VAAHGNQPDGIQINRGTVLLALLEWRPGGYRDSEYGASVENSARAC